MVVGLMAINPMGSNPHQKSSWAACLPVECVKVGIGPLVKMNTLQETITYPTLV